jgi:hypothetical protein
MGNPLTLFRDRNKQIATVPRYFRDYHAPKCTLFVVCISASRPAGTQQGKEKNKHNDAHSSFAFKWNTAAIVFPFPC